MVYTKHGPKQSGRKGSYFNNHWYDDIVVLDDDQREMPQTVPHDVVQEHRYGCMCPACQAYPGTLLWELKHAHQKAQR